MSNSVSNITVRTFDEYLVKKIESAIMKDQSNKPLLDVIYSPYDLAFEYAMKRQQVLDKNKIKFPLIICHKSSGFTVSDMTHRVLGTKIPIYSIDYKVTDPDTLEETRVSRYLQVINVDIPYTIDILTKDENQAYELAQEVIFLLIRDPYVDVPMYRQSSSVPSEEKKMFRFALLMENEVSDNTALETESDAGKLYRVTISATVEDAALTRDITAYMADKINVKIEISVSASLPGSIAEINIE